VPRRAGRAPDPVVLTTTAVAPGRPGAQDGVPTRREPDAHATPDARTELSPLFGPPLGRASGTGGRTVSIPAEPGRSRTARCERPSARVRPGAGSGPHPGRRPFRGCPRGTRSREAPPRTAAATAGPRGNRRGRPAPSPPR